MPIDHAMGLTGEVFDYPELLCLDGHDTGFRTNGRGSERWRVPVIVLYSVAGWFGIQPQR
jgi:hypothetical protein